MSEQGFELAELAEFSPDVIEGDDFLTYHLKSHKLIFSALDLSARMIDIMALMLTHMKASDWVEDRQGVEHEVVPVYRFTNDQLAEWFNCPKKQLYSMLKKACEKLAEKKIGVEDDGSKFKYHPLLSEASYENGVFVISPNSKLREVYLINSARVGFAKVDNQILHELSSSNAKRVFDFLSRFRYDYEMYAMTVRKLQVLFAAIAPDGTPLKKSYVLQKRFVDLVIAPALKEIASCDSIKDKLEILEGKDGNLGYELEEQEIGRYKIKFKIRWHNQLSREQLIKVSREAMSLYEKLKSAKRLGPKATLPIIEELETKLRLLGRDDQADQAQAKIADIKKKLAIEARLNDSSHFDEELKKLDIYANAFDELDD